jgi:hypothetical protein
VVAIRAQTKKRATKRKKKNKDVFLLKVGRPTCEKKPWQQQAAQRRLRASPWPLSAAFSSLAARASSCVAHAARTPSCLLSGLGRLPASLRCPHSPLAPAHPPTPSAPWQASHVVILLAKKYPNYKIVNFDKL